VSFYTLRFIYGDVVSKLTSRTNSTFGFLPTRKPRPKKPKELFFANAQVKIELNTENRNPK
jgi:hypothetical protein